MNFVKGNNLIRQMVEKIGQLFPSYFSVKFYTFGSQFLRFYQRKILTWLFYVAINHDGSIDLKH